MLILLIHCHHNSQCAVVNIVTFPLQETSDEKENYFFRVAEAIFVGWFSLEYTVRIELSNSDIDMQRYLQYLEKVPSSGWL